jgi:hypothetical protein
MSTKIYKLVLIRGYTEAYYQLSEEERQRYVEQRRAAVREAGAKATTPFYDCRWSNDEYATFFIMEYPDVESAMKDTAGVEKVGSFRYLVSETILGIERGTGPTV